MKSKNFVKEDIVTDAHEMNVDHEIQMAREELYHAAENAITLHKLLRHVSEAQGLEAWVSSKITLANDYLKTVREYLEYELMTMNSNDPTVADNTQLPIAEGTESGVAEAFSDVSGLLAASHLNRSFIITAELAEGGTKRFRVKAQSERVAKEKFLQHHSQAKILKVDEENISEVKSEQDIDNFTIDDIKKLEQIKDLDTLKQQAKILIKGKPAKRMKPEKIAYFYDKIDQFTSPLRIIKLMYDLLLAGEGLKTVGGKDTMAPNVYRQRFGEEKTTTNETTSAGAVATVTNPASSKPKSQIGSLFGGTYKQRKAKKK